MAKIRSKKYDGVYYNELQNGDKSYFITYKDINRKNIWESIGKYSNGIREQYCFEQRAQRVNVIKNGEETRKQVLKRQRAETLITVNDLFDYYINTKKMKATTSGSFKGAWNIHVRNTLGKIDARKLTANDIMEEREKWKISEATKARIVGHIGASYRFSTVYNEAYKDIASPMDTYTAFDKAITRKEVIKQRRNTRSGYLSLDDIRKLREAIIDDPISQIAVEIMLSTGVRVAGALALRKCDINLSNQTIILTDFKAGGETYRGYMSPQLKELLEKKLPLLPNKNAFVISHHGEAMPYRTLSRYLKKILDKLFNEGLDERNSKERIVLHSLRHTFASQLAIKGTPIYTIKKLLNHADITMTMRYAKLAPDSGKDAVLSLYE